MAARSVEPPRPELAEIVDRDAGREGRAVTVRTIAPADRAALRLVLVAVALLLLAVAKPWTAPGAPPPPLADRAAAPIADAVSLPPSIGPESPLPTPDAAALAAPVCLGAGAWRIASLETWRGRAVRVWRAIEPLPDLSGPQDPRVPLVPVGAADAVAALGWCAPAFGPDRPVGPVSVSAWRVEGGAASSIPLDQVAPERGTSPLAALYGPPPVPRPPQPCPSGLGCPVSARASWRSGTYVFRYTEPGYPRQVWFGALVTVGGSAATDSAATPAR